MFEQLFNSPLLYSLSLTLVHFLWQGLLVALILKSVLFIVDKNKSKLRYALATFAMLANAVLATLTFIMVYPDTSLGINSNISAIQLTSLVNELTQQNTLSTYQELLPSILAYSLPYLSLLWLATIAILASKLLIEVRNVNNLPLHSSVAPSSELLARFNELAKQIKLTKAPRLLISLKAEVPMAIGWLKPVVLLPASMVTGLDSAQLEMLILHELAHIRRHDYLVNFLQTLIELLFFFHPSVHWIGKQMRDEREYCSDDIAVQHCGDAIAYAHTLTDTASLCAKNHIHTIPTMAMAASGGNLKARVLRLVDHHCAPANNTSKWLAATSLLLALTLLSINQLLTMSLPQQLNKQFPWQETNAATTRTHIASAVSILADTAEMEMKNGYSIALPLLINEETKVHSSTDNINNKLIQENILEDNNIAKSPAIIKSAIDDHNSHPQKAGPTNKADTNQNINKLALQQSNMVEVAAQKIEELEPTKNQDTLKLAVKEQDLFLSPSQVQVMLPQIETASAAQAKKSSTTSIDFAEKKHFGPGNSSSSAAYQNNLNTRNTADKQLSYRQELAQLATTNSLYQASHVVRTENTQSKSTDKLAFTSLEIPEPAVSLEAKLLNSISPIYPSLAKRRGIEMEVKVNFIIDRNGKVKDINFSQQSKLSYFKSAIRSAIKKWRFSPATINNRKVESKMSKIFSFSLEK
ncbi:MAG: M56 family metallopeptidase [Colwellia sp.]|nr:M56 family metallopeptidase [Colwellia sp.]